MLAFWLAYILTRPLGASLGDFLTQAPIAGGLGLSMMLVSGIFVALILLLVTYLTVTGNDRLPAERWDGSAVGR